MKLMKNNKHIHRRIIIYINLDIFSRISITVMNNQKK